MLLNLLFTDGDLYNLLVLLFKHGIQRSDLSLFLLEQVVNQVILLLLCCHLSLFLLFNFYHNIFQRFVQPIQLIIFLFKHSSLLLHLFPLSLFVYLQFIYLIFQVLKGLFQYIILQFNALLGLSVIFYCFM